MNNRIKLIIFSMNRSSQLRLLLQSLSRHSNYLFDITVIFRYTNDAFKAGYEKLFDEVYSSDEENEFAPLLPVVFLPEDERGFAYTLDYELNNKTSHELLAFSTDDVILYRNIPFSYDRIREIVAANDCATLSLRTGLDVTIETYFKGNKLPLLVFEHYGDHIAWFHKNYNPNSLYGYPLSVDLNIFESKFFINLLSKIDYDNPNSLEGAISNFSHRLEMPNYTAAPLQQLCTSVPVNTVSSWQNRAGDFYPQSAESLNEAYLDGYVIDADWAIAQCENHQQKCSHNELDYILIPQGK